MLIPRHNSTKYIYFYQRKCAYKKCYLIQHCCSRQQPTGADYRKLGNACCRRVPFPHHLQAQTYFWWRSWSHSLRPKKLHASVAVPAAPVKVPSQRPLAPNVASVTLVANKGDNEMILGAVHRSPDICFRAEETP